MPDGTRLTGTYTVNHVDRAKHPHHNGAAWINVTSMTDPEVKRLNVAMRDALIPEWLTDGTLAKITFDGNSDVTKIERA